MKYLILLVVALTLSCGAGSDIEKMPNLDGYKMPKTPEKKSVTYSVSGTIGDANVFAVLPGGTISGRVKLPWSTSFTCIYCNLFVDVCKITEDVPTRSDINVQIIINGRSVGTIDNRREDCVEASYKKEQ